MNKFLLLFISFLLTLSSFGQKKYLIKGIVKNPKGKLVENAKVSFSSTPLQYTRTNKKGEFEIRLTYSPPTELIIKHVSYTTEKITLTKRKLKKTKNNLLYLEILLRYNTLTEFIVNGKSVPDTVFGSELTSVSDYEFIGDNLLVLSYRKSLKKNGYLQLTSKKNELISSCNTPPKPKSLFRDFENKLYLITEHKIYLITIFNNDIRLRPIDNKQFNSFTSKVIDTSNSHFIYSNFSSNYPAFNYYSQHLTDTTAKTIHHVENLFMMDLYRAEYKYANPRQKLWAFRQELVTGIDKEIWVGASNFTQSLYYEPLYAPLFVNRDTLLIFDHYNDYLYKINTEDFNKIDSTSITYHKKKDKKNWEQPILKDKEVEKIYALFLKGGYYYLKPINLYDGSTSISFKLRYRYAENVKIKNGYAYYIYRPFESSQKKYLYRELINY